MSHNQVLDASPWLAPEAILAMDSFLGGIPAPMVFEWGAGGSTLFFAKRAVRVFSVESQHGWYERVERRLIDSNITNVNLIWLSEFFNYAERIVKTELVFDLVLVDGVQRNACVLAAELCIRKGGWLVLDNTERNVEYAEALSLLSLREFERRDYQGDGFITSIFINP